MKYQKVSLFVIGTELTRGIITDGHIKLISSELTHLGYDVMSAELLPDDGSIVDSLTNGVKKTDVVIVTGGLGPTSDDMTRNIIAHLAGVDLVLNQKELDILKKKVKFNYNEPNLKQVMIPSGFTAITNNYGTAPGFRGIIKCEGKDVLCVAMPGPPRELQPMFYNDVLPLFASLRGHSLASRDEYSVFLIPEAKLEEVCAKYARKGILWGTRFQNTKISLYLSGGSEEDRIQLYKDLQKELGQGTIVPGNFEAVDLLVDKLKKRKMTISTAESISGGLISKILTDINGSSSYFWGGAATYANEAKHKILGVDQSVLDTVGPVSRECAMQMADGIRKISGTDLAVSTTGFAGPTGKEVGTVWFGFSSSERETVAVKVKFNVTTRDFVRRRAAVASIVLACLYLDGNSVLDIAKSWQYT